MGSGDRSMMEPWHIRVEPRPPKPEDRPMTTVEKLRALARELAGEAWDHDRRCLPAQAYVRREAAKAVMKQADRIQREDSIFDDPPEESTDAIT